MFKTTLAATAFAVLPLVAGAATFNPGVPVDESTVVATGEMHIGDRGGNATKEIRVDNLATGGYDAQTNFAWVNDDAYGFNFNYTAATQQLTLNVAGTSVSTIMDLTGANALYITARGNDGGSMSLSNLKIGEMLAPVDVVGTGGNRDWLEILGVNLGVDWSLTGDVAFAGVPGGSQNSKWNATIKIAEVAPVPLPAAGILLLGALGGLGLVKRRRKVA